MLVPETRRYVVINTEDLSKVNFSEVLQSSDTPFRYSNDGRMVILKYDGSMPTSILSLTTKTEYDYAGILTLLATREWEVVDELEE